MDYFEFNTRQPVEEVRRSLEPFLGRWVHVRTKYNNTILRMYGQLERFGENIGLSGCSGGPHPESIDLQLASLFSYEIKGEEEIQIPVPFYKCIVSD